MDEHTAVGKLSTSDSDQIKHFGYILEPVFTVESTKVYRRREVCFILVSWERSPNQTFSGCEASEGLVVEWHKECGSIVGFRLFVFVEMRPQKCSHRLVFLVCTSLPLNHFRILKAAQKILVLTVT